tara:strand:- start:7999 stop:8181 length:183 start_codon:yes stop_codon:yes gene_type:complete
MTEIERLTHIKEFLFLWLVDVLKNSNGKQGNIPMEVLVQEQIDKYIQVKQDLKDGITRNG